MEQREYEENKVQQIIRQRDRDSSGYLHTYFDANWDDSNLYDLEINTRTMTLNKSVEMITCAVDTDKIKELLSDTGIIRNKLKINAAIQNAFSFQMTHKPSMLMHIFSRMLLDTIDNLRLMVIVN